MDESKMLTAYNVKTKEKKVPIFDAVLTRTAKGSYMAQGFAKGVDGRKGAKLTTLLSVDSAKQAVANGVATWAEGSEPK